jgi:hypothetical protein
MATHYDYLLRASRCSGAGPAPSARENQTTRAVFNDLFKRMIISNQGRSRDAGARTTALGHARRRRDTNALRSVARRLAETPRRRARLSRGRHRKRSAACEASLLELLEECQPARTILLAALADAEKLAIALAVDRRRHPRRYVPHFACPAALQHDPDRCEANQRSNREATTTLSCYPSFKAWRMRPIEGEHERVQTTCSARHAGR